MQEPIRVTVWNEYFHEQNTESIRKIYPNGIHTTIADMLNEKCGITAGTATLQMPEHGLTQDVLDETDVLIWWGHLKHQDVADEIVKRVQTRVLQGMGLICLHSAHASKIFSTLMGTRSGILRWRESGQKERLWVIDPGHPIAEGLGDYIEIPHEEMYGEVFEIPDPDHIVFISWFAGGEVFRSGICYKRGAGKIFYFRPGHESFPIYYQKEVQQVIENAVRWAAPDKRGKVTFTMGHTEHPEPIEDYKGE